MPNSITNSLSVSSHIFVCLCLVKNRRNSEDSNHTDFITNVYSENTNLFEVHFDNEMIIDLYE